MCNFKLAASKNGPQASYLPMLCSNALSPLLQPEGDFAKASETALAFNDKKAQRPVIHRLYDHGSQVIPEGKLSSRYSGRDIRMCRCDLPHYC
jgi:hypothetical protein